MLVKKYIFNILFGINLAFADLRMASSPKKIQLQFIWNQVILSIKD